jgi:hypothetical protein
MSEFKFDVATLFRTNLQDRYKDDNAILKELIQNADDAGASCLHIGLVMELPRTNHPLLNGPGLFVLNNGLFKDKDAVAIRWMGLNYKSSDTSTIGKFGYGLKSVFHLCEAFFFLSSGALQVEIGDESYDRNDILMINIQIKVGTYFLPKLNRILKTVYQD